MTLKQILYSLPPLLTAALLAGLAAAALARGRRAPGGPLFALLCLTGSVLSVDILINFNAPTERIAHLASCGGHLLYPFLLPLFIHYFHIILRIQTRRWLVYGAYGYGLLVAFCAANGWIITGVRRFDFGFFAQGGPLYFLMAAGAAMAAIYNLVILYQAIVREPRSIQKNKLKYIFVGFGILGLLSSLNNLTVLGLALYPPGAFGFIPLLIFAAGIFRHDLLDMGLLLRKSLLYSLLTAVLAAFSLLLMVLVQRLFKQFQLTDSLLFPVVLVALMVAGFGPLKNLIQGIIEPIWVKGRYDYRQTLRHVSQTIATVMDKHKITRLLEETLVGAMQVNTCALFLIDPAARCYRAIAVAGRSMDPTQWPALPVDDPLIQRLQKIPRPLMKQQLLGASGDDGQDIVLAELNRLEGEVILPMRFKEQLNGFLVLGEKHSAEIYTSEDLDLLEPLCHQSAVAIQNAQAYQALSALNRTLEEKVAERTRDLEAALAEKERSQEQLIRSESLAALGQLVAGVAHELNNPLTSVTSLLQSTVEDLRQWDTGQPVDDQLMDDLHFADKELARAKAIVASLLGLARQTQTYEEAVDMNLVVRDALRVLHNQYKHARLNMVEALGADLPTLQGNFANLGQVALNIVQNAIQAVADRDGRIKISTCYEADTRQVVFTCQDNGPGIPTAIRQDVFKPFFTTKPVGQGTGLGLYICHQIVQRHNGTITLEAVQPHGTAVVVRLPVG